jgi:hypothetical protein
MGPEVPISGISITWPGSDLSDVESESYNKVLVTEEHGNIYSKTAKDW